eukprot:SAG31_NODE_331_length_17518_cov_32.495042_14_plen_223_part_00
MQMIVSDSPCVFVLSQHQQGAPEAVPHATCPHIHHDCGFSDWNEAIGGCTAGPDAADDGANSGRNMSHSVTDLWMADDGGGEHGATANGNSSCVFCNGSAPPGVDPAEYKPMYNGASLLGVNGTLQDYEEWKFGQYAESVIRKHNTSDHVHPLFLNYNMHVIHEPLQAPRAYFTAQALRTNATFPDATNQPRAIYHSMVKFADDGGSESTTINQPASYCRAH